MKPNELARALDLVLIPAVLICIIGITIGLCLLDASPTRTARQSIAIVRAPAVETQAVQSRGLSRAAGACEPYAVAARGAH